MAFWKWFWKKSKKEKNKDEPMPPGPTEEDMQEAGFTIPIPVEPTDRKGHKLNKTWSISRSGRYKVKKRERGALDNQLYDGHDQARADQPQTQAQADMHHHPHENYHHDQRDTYRLTQHNAPQPVM